MSACPNCIRSAKHEWHMFTATCRMCSARMMSRGPDFAEAKRTGTQPATYRRALISMGLLHEDVKAAAAVDRCKK